VVSHVRIAEVGCDIQAARVPTAGADLLLGFDLAVTLQDAAFSKIARGRTHAILNTHETITGAFTRDAEWTQPTDTMRKAIKAVTGDDRAAAFDATGVAIARLGDSIAANLLVLGLRFSAA
jgi:indolepyruvate ferredoxin oxidoreductase